MANFSLLKGATHLVAGEAAHASAATVLKGLVNGGGYGNVVTVAALCGIRTEELNEMLSKSLWSFAEINLVASALGKTVNVSVGSLASATVSNKALTSNVATITTSAPHGFVTGNSVVVSGVGAPFDGTYVIASVPTTTTFTYARTNANVTSAVATGTAVSFA